MTVSTELSIDERAQHFLKVLIERYIREGTPIGSRTLAKDAGMDLSPATVRNVMSDLEELGFITSPHTSAGRVPTISGYRLFVDTLISLKPMDATSIAKVQEELALDISPNSLVESASRLLSGMTHMAGVVMVPKHEHVTVKQIEFIPMSNTRILTVLVTSQGEVMNRIIETSKQFSPSELVQAANYINKHYAGCALEKMHEEIVREMSEARNNMDILMAQMLKMADEAIRDDKDHDFVLAGQTNLMSFNELAEIDRLRRLFDAFAEKQEILHLLDRSMHADGVQIFIGEESGYGKLEECSVITAPYQMGEDVVGVLGVIGPTRMAYDRVIPIVDITAKLLGSALKSH